jgi:hypothetical protein
MLNNLPIQAESEPPQKRPEICKNGRKTDLFGGKTKINCSKTGDLQWLLKPIIFN